ncbi:MAG: hypothetical protein JJE04_07540 [Acidobacteriia bacterium]|nr:hypothetical protein [Terriglobia bacterium]
MQFATFTRCAASILFCVSLLVPAFAQRPAEGRSTQSQPVEVPFFAVVETIEFKDVPQEEQKLVLDRIGVRVGDMLTVEVRHRIGREIGKIRKGMTFTYKAGSAWGTVKLVISADC